MSEIWLAWLAILAGFVGLVWSADRFVAGSAAMANNFGVSKLIIGLTIVSLGTSAPEIVVSISASLQDSGDLAVGNALGSNIANIGLILAITALITPLPVQKHIINQEIPILAFVTIAAGIVLFDGYISALEGWLMLISIIPLISFMIYNKKQHPEDNSEDEDIADMSTLFASLWFLAGLVVLIGSSETLVWGAKVVATHFNVPPLIVGLTVVAIGTSLPELAASITSALKGHQEMALGNVIGSNIFNILTVMATPGIINPPTMGSEVFARDFTTMGLITLLLCCAILIDYQIRHRKGHGQGHAHLGRKIGLLLLAGYFAYYGVLFLQ